MVGSSRTGATDNCELLCVSWEINKGPMQAKSALNHYIISLAYCLSVYLSNKTRCKIYTPQAIYFQALYIFFENHLPKNVMKVYAHIGVVCSPLS